MTSLWPMFSAPTDRQAGRLPLYRDILMDYEAGRPVWEGGDPVMVTGLEAVKGWAWRAIATARYRYLHFSWSYGCELEALVGQPYRADHKLRRGGPVRPGGSGGQPLHPSCTDFRRPL